MADTLGDKPIEEKHLRIMQNLAHAICAALNGGDECDTAFVLLVFPMAGHEGRCNYISNTNRDDVMLMLEEQLARFQGKSPTMGTEVLL